MTEAMPAQSPTDEPTDMETKWKAEEEARMAAMGVEADPWDKPDEQRTTMETKEEPPLEPSQETAPIDMEEMHRKAREDALAQVKRIEEEDNARKAQQQMERDEQERERQARAELGDVGKSVDPEFLTSLIKAGLGYQGILEVLKGMEVASAKDLQAVKYQDLVDSGLKPIQARKLKAIGMRSLHQVEAPKEIKISRKQLSSASPLSKELPPNQSVNRNNNASGSQLLTDTGGKGGKTKKGSMFKRMSSAMGMGGNSHASAFAADLESDDGSSNVGPTTDDYFEEGTQRYFKVERRVNNGEFTWATLSPGLRKEMVEVKDLWQQAADNGHPKAWHNLGYIYENGSGMPRDAKKAVQCWTKAAEYGDMDAQYNLGVMYAKGRGVERNEAKAVELLTQAADKGDANAQLNLGIMYAKGRGVGKDESKAFQLWARAAEQGHASAQYNLGAMFATGRGVEKDLERAVHLYHQAATQGVVQAQYSLGLMYQYGKSVEQNTGMAIELFARAARQGHAKAQQHLEQLQRDTSPTEQDSGATESSL
mmetsp:Transcript_80516/g.160687  ORF Transcript_80516/g.160687 Transcript_80516/m.160687 type:complete len:538 (+) Transcript_80516:234-1847(+)